jgi:transposase InsO family protein
LSAADIQLPDMEKKAQDFVKHCVICQKVRRGEMLLPAAMTPIVARAPFEEISVDTMGPLQEDENNFKYILCITDSFSRYVELIPTKDCTAKTAALGIVSVIARYGAPRSIRSDQGVQFTAGIIQELLLCLGVQHTVTAAYHPEANGICERSHQETLRHLRALIAVAKVNNWSTMLPLVQRTQNDTFCRAIGMTPTELLFGKMVSPLRFITGSRDRRLSPQKVLAAEFAQGLCKMQAKLLETSADALRKYVETNVNNHPEHIRKFSEGQYVLVENKSTRHHKLETQWIGPLVVVSKESDALYKCQDLRSKQISTYATARLKRCWIKETDDPVIHAAMDSKEYPVEAVVDHYLGANRKDCWFQIRWKNFGPEDDTWLPYKEVHKLEALDRYLETHPQVRLPIRRGV